MSDRLGSLLHGEIAPGVYRWASRASAINVVRRAEQVGWRCFALDGQRIAFKDDFLRACAAAMHLPAYFGYNWDALEDALRDLAWTPAERGYLVLYDGTGHFAHARPDEFAVALSILHDAVDSWRPTPTPMAVLLRGLGRAGPRIPLL
jgi:hypothetical protein